MTALTTVSNATFDTACAAVPGPYGPLTRVGDLNALPRVVPNSRTPIDVTGQNSVAFQITYEDLVNVGARDNILKEVYGRAAFLRKLKTFAEILFREANNLTLLTATTAQIQAVMKLFQYYPEIIGVLGPTFTYEEVSKTNEIKASFTVSGSGLSRSFVNTSTGYLPKLWVWDFGDGTYSFAQNPTPKTWTAGTYSVKLHVAGHGGLSTSATTTVVAS